MIDYIQWNISWQTKQKCLLALTLHEKRQKLEKISIAHICVFFIIFIEFYGKCEYKKYIE